MEDHEIGYIWRQARIYTESLEKIHENSLVVGLIIKLVEARCLDGDGDSLRNVLQVFKIPTQEWSVNIGGG